MEKFVIRRENIFMLFLFFANLIAKLHNGKVSAYISKNEYVNQMFTQGWVYVSVYQYAWNAINQ